MKLIFILFFAIAVPWLLFKLAMWTLIPFFGITGHPQIAAVLFTCIPDVLSIGLAFTLASGKGLPDN